MNDPPFCMNLATEKAMSSAGRRGTGPPNWVNLLCKIRDNGKGWSAGKRHVYSYEPVVHEGDENWWLRQQAIYQPVQASVHIFGL